MLDTRTKLLDSAIEVFIEKGFTGSSVDEICKRAGTTKGAFFHHFENKQEVGLLALEKFARQMTSSFSEAVQDPTVPPVRRLFDYLDRVILVGESLKPFPMCLVAVLTLELAASNPAFCAAAKTAFSGWLDELEQLLVAAIAASPKARGLVAREVAEFFLATIEGSMILARARDDGAVFQNTVLAFKRYLQDTLI